MSDVCMMRGRPLLLRQAARAQKLFPDTQLHWFERSRHFPQWDVPEEAVQMILASA